MTLREGGRGASTWALVTVAVFQAIICLFQFGIWSTVRDHEGRLRKVESEYWKKSDHEGYESRLDITLREMNVTLRELELAVREHIAQTDTDRRVRR